MGIQQNLQTLISNPTIQKRYIQWITSRTLTGRLPHIDLPQGYRLFPADKFNDFSAIATQHPDLNEFRLVNDLLSTPADNIFVDVGANVGAMTLLAHSTGRTKAILAFEPSHRYCSAWHYNVSYNDIKNATLIQTAVGDFNGEIDFRIDPTMPLNNKIDKGEVHFSSQVKKVRIITLDSICHSLNIDYITLLKIDVEGAEPIVIRGAKELLSQRKIRNILFEFIVEFVEDMDEDPYLFIRTLHELGFDIYEINPNGELGKILNEKEIIDDRRVSPNSSERPFHGINLVAKLRS